MIGAKQGIGAKQWKDAKAGKDAETKEVAGAGSVEASAARPELRPDSGGAGGT